MLIEIQLLGWWYVCVIYIIYIYNTIHIRFGGYVYDILYTYYTVLSADFLDFRSK